MEAAAARSFLGVPGSILQMCLRDIRAKALRNRHEDIYTLISAYSADWGWDEEDIARAMMPVLPGQTSAPKGRTIAPATATMAPAIARIAAIAKAMSCHGQVYEHRQGTCKFHDLGHGRSRSRGHDRRHDW